MAISSYISFFLKTTRTTVKIAAVKFQYGIGLLVKPVHIITLSRGQHLDLATIPHVADTLHSSTLEVLPVQPFQGNAALIYMVTMPSACRFQSN